MIFDQSRLANALAKNITSSLSITTATQATIMAEKKLLSEFYEKQLRGARITQRDLYEVKFDEENCQFAYHIFTNCIVNEYLEFKILKNAVSINLELVNLLNQKTSQLCELLDNSLVTLSCENNNGTNYDISAGKLQELLSGKISFIDFGKELLDSMDERYETIPERISIWGDGLAQFCEEALVGFEIKKVWENVFSDIGKFYLKLYSDLGPAPIMNDHAIYLLNYFTESTEEFKLNFNERKKQSMSVQEMNEEEYFVEQIQLFKNCINDLDNFQQSHAGHGSLGKHVFELLLLAQEKIGERKLYYSLKRKLEFVEGNEIYINFQNRISDADKCKSNKEINPTSYDKVILKLKTIWIVCQRN